MKNFNTRNYIIKFFTMEKMYSEIKTDRSDKK